MGWTLPISGGGPKMIAAISRADAPATSNRVEARKWTSWMPRDPTEHFNR
jgi:hypothetical protein